MSSPEKTEITYIAYIHLQYIYSTVDSCIKLRHSVNLIVFTLLLIHLILRISPHHSHYLRSNHLSLPRPIAPDLKLASFTNPFLYSHSDCFWVAFTDLEPVLN